MLSKFIVSFYLWKRRLKRCMLHFKSGEETRKWEISAHFQRLKKRETWERRFRSSLMLQLSPWKFTGATLSPRRSLMLHCLQEGHCYYKCLLRSSLLLQLSPQKLTTATTVWFLLLPLCLSSSRLCSSPHATITVILKRESDSTYL